MLFQAEQRKDARLASVGISVRSARSILCLGTVSASSDCLITSNVDPCSISEHISTLCIRYQSLLEVLRE